MYMVSDVHFGARIYPKIYKSGTRRTMSKSAVPYLYGAEETIPIEQLHPFANHPFHVRHDLELWTASTKAASSMADLADKLKAAGIKIKLIKATGQISCTRQWVWMACGSPLMHSAWAMQQMKLNLP